MALLQKRGLLVFLAVAAKAEVSRSGRGRWGWLRSARVAQSRGVAERLVASSGSAIAGERALAVFGRVAEVMRVRRSPWLASQMHVAVRRDLARALFVRESVGSRQA